MKRSEIRGLVGCIVLPDFAALHPGYGTVLVPSQAARRMAGAKRYPSNGVHASMGFAKGSTHPTKLKLIPVIACDKHEAFAQGSEATIAVGTPIAERPPHRTVRAAFPHTAPTSSE